MPYLVDRNVGGDISIGIEFSSEQEDTIVYKLSRGEALSEEEQASIPRLVRTRQRRRKKGLSDVFSMGVYPYFLSPLLRDKLEELSPGKVVFLPMDVRGMNEKDWDQSFGTYYMALPPRLDAIVIEETTFAKGHGDEGYQRSGGWISVLDESRCVIHSQAVDGHHLWRLPLSFGVDPDNSRSFGWDGWFCSEELRDFIKSERLTGWVFRKKCVLKKV